MTYQPAPEELKQRIFKFMEKNRGKLYHPIPHPDFDHLPVAHGHDRFEVLRPHLPVPPKRVLDIGTHWGQFAYWLEDQGFSVTAVEHSPEYAYIARGLRDLTGRRFEIIQASIFDVQDVSYDIILALNIFHHFLKTERGYRGLIDLLDRIETPLMFFQTHVAEEKQMAGAYTNFQPEEFADFVCTRGGFNRVEQIGTAGPRRIYKLTK